MKSDLQRLLCLAALLTGGIAPFSWASDGAGLILRTNAVVDSQGVFLAQVLASEVDVALPELRLADPPSFGQALILTRAQVTDLLQRAAPDLAGTNWSGAERIRITRRTRVLASAEIQTLLTGALQRELGRGRGELELRFNRPWRPVAIADEPLEAKLLDLPPTGLTPNLLIRFELRHGSEVFGTWQLPAQARLWADVFLARNGLRRGHSLLPTDVVSERRDVLALRDGLTELPFQLGPIEILENTQPGAPILARAFRIRPLVNRGQIMDGRVQEGALSIELKVEILEDGSSGQIVRVRNLQTRRELRGKIQNEQSILLLL